MALSFPVGGGLFHGSEVGKQRTRMRATWHWLLELPLRECLAGAIRGADGSLVAAYTMTRDFGRKKAPPIARGLLMDHSFIVVAPDYAARVADSVDASGTGPQMYAEKTGVGSVLSPLEMMMPSGSADAISLRSFFISLSLVGATRVARLSQGSRRTTLDVYHK